MATMDNLIDEILEEFRTQRETPILDDPIPEDVERNLPRHLSPQQPFIDLDIQAPPPTRLPANEQWVEILNDAKNEFEFDGATAVFSTWRVEAEDPLDIGDIQIADGIEVRAGRMVLDARMTDERAAHLLQKLPEGEYMLKIKFLREHDEGDWVIEDKFDPVKMERRRGQAVVTISNSTMSGALTGIDRPYFENAYPVTAVVYGLYSLRDPDPANLAPLRDGDLNCVAQRVVEHFDGALRGHGLTPIRRQKIMEWEEKVGETRATVEDVVCLEKILKRAIILRDIAGENMYNSGKYGRGGNGGHRPIELIVHNGHG